jgi:hypothetical protein
VSSEGARIAAALRHDPLYVDPAYAGALPPAQRAQLIRRIRRSPVPIHVVLVPIVAGSTWQSSTQVSTVVQSYLGRDGAYVTFDADFGDVFDVVMYGGTDEQQQSARDAGWAVSYEKRYKTLAARLGRCVDLIATGTGSVAYKKAHDAEFTPGPTPRPAARPAGGHGDLGIPIGIAALAAVAGGLVWLRRRRDRAAMEALRLPRTVFGTALAAGDDELRARAERDLIALGESLDGKEHALDAYDAAGRTLDRARTTADLAGVLALIQAAKDGPPLCYFDPRRGHDHGDLARAGDAPEAGGTGLRRVREGGTRPAGARRRPRSGPPVLRGRDAVGRDRVRPVRRSGREGPWRVS